MRKKMGPPTPSPLAAMDRSYQDENDHSTMSRAAEIQQDPSRMAGVKRHHRKVKKQMSLVQRQLTGAVRR